jgi:hypothetical protein
MLAKDSGIYIATEEEIEILLPLIDRAHGHTLDILMGWLKNSDNNSAVRPDYVINMLQENKW